MTLHKLAHSLGLRRAMVLLFFTLTSVLTTTKAWSKQEPKAAIQVLVLKPQTQAAEHDKAAEVVANLLTAELAEIEGLELSSYTDLSELAQSGDADSDCQDQDCAMEIAGAMGVRYVVTSLLEYRSGAWNLHLAVYDLDLEKYLGRRKFAVNRVEDLPTVMDHNLKKWFISVMDKDVSIQAHAALLARDRDAETPAQKPEKLTAKPVKTEHDTGAARSALPPVSSRAGLALLGLGASALLAVASLGASDYWAKQLADPGESQANKDIALSFGPWVLVGGLLLSSGLMTVSAGLAFYELGS